MPARQGPWWSELTRALSNQEESIVEGEIVNQPDSEISEYETLMNLAESFVGTTISKKLSGILGEDVESINQVIQTGLSGFAADMISLAQEEIDKDQSEAE